MSNQIWFIHDTETTPIGATPVEVVEIGSVVMTEAGIIGEYTSLVNPGLQHLQDKCVDDKERLPYNDIPLAEVLAARSKEVVAAEWHEWMAKWSTFEQTHHAYNNAFDFRHLGLEPWNITPEMAGECVMLAATHAADRFRWIKLSCARELFGIALVEGDTHRALPDAKTAALVYLEILKRRAEEGSIRL